MLLFAIGGLNAALAAELATQIEDYQVDLTTLPWVSFLIAGMMAGFCGIAWFSWLWSHRKIDGDRGVQKLAAHASLSAVMGILAMAVQASRQAEPCTIVVTVIIAGLVPNLVVNWIERKVSNLIERLAK